MPRKTASKRSRSSHSRKKVDQKVRLQRLLASAGFGSRRQCEELIEAGRVVVDGEVVTQLGTTVDASLQKVKVDGVLLKKQKLVYYAVNKPVGFVTTNRDPHGRPRVIDLVPPDERVFPVGRLDRSSEGLILLTNDGELAQRLTHPKFGVRKVYRVIVAGKVDGETMKKMRQGVYIAEGFVKVEGAKLIKSRSRATEMEIVLREGKNREIRRILARLGHKVQQLRRIAVGPLRLGDVPPGAYRAVSSQEVEKLWVATEATVDSDDARRGGSGAKKSRPPKRGTKKDAGRRPIKKTRSSKSDGKTERSGKVDFPFSFGESKTTGAVIGGDPSPESERPKSGKRATGKRASSSTRGSKKRSNKKRTTSSDSGSGKSANRKTARKGSGNSSYGGGKSGGKKRASTKKGAGTKKRASTKKGAGTKKGSGTKTRSTKKGGARKSTGGKSGGGKSSGQKRARTTKKRGR